MSTNIQVIRHGESFEILVKEAEDATRHRVTDSAGLLRSFAPDVAPEAAIEAAFRFLLDREPKESILRTFDVSVIPRYFPGFKAEFARYLR